MAKLFKSKEESKVETPIVESVETSIPEVTIVVEEEKKEEVVTHAVEVKKPTVNKEEIVSKLGELSTIFRNLYGEQLNPVFAEIHKSLSNAQYKIMQNL